MLVTYAHCHVCNKEEPLWAGEKLPDRWYVLPNPFRGDPPLHVCSHVCLLKWAEEEHRSQEEGFARCRRDELKV